MTVADDLGAQLRAAKAAGDVDTVKQLKYLLATARQMERQDAEANGTRDPNQLGVVSNYDGTAEE